MNVKNLMELTEKEVQKLSNTLKLPPQKNAKKAKDALFGYFIPIHIDYMEDTLLYQL